jgi:hypothetical protein
MTLGNMRENGVWSPAGPGTGLHEIVFAGGQAGDVFVGSPLARFDPGGCLCGGAAERKAHPRASLAPASAASASRSIATAAHRSGALRGRPGRAAVGRAPRGCPQRHAQGPRLIFLIFLISDFRREKIKATSACRTRAITASYPRARSHPLVSLPEFAILGEGVQGVFLLPTKAPQGLGAKGVPAQSKKRSSGKSS